MDPSGGREGVRHQDPRQEEAHTRRGRDEDGLTDARLGGEGGRWLAVVSTLMLLLHYDYLPASLLQVTDLLQEVEVLRFLRHPNIIRWGARGGKECAASVLYDHDSNYSRDADAASISYYGCCNGWCWLQVRGVRGGQDELLPGDGAGQGRDAGDGGGYCQGVVALVLMLLLLLLCFCCCCQGGELLDRITVKVRRRTRPRSSL